MDPHEVRFSQHSISYRFSEGGTIDDLAAALRAGTVEPEDLPPLRLVLRRGQWFTLDNRRLEAFRRAGLPIHWREATAAELEAEAWKFTTKNAGVSVHIRGEAK
jgi:hypothetical protein